MSDSSAGAPDWSRITVIMITHHGAAVVGDSLIALKQAPHIIVVDNASDDDTLDIVRACVPQARIVENAVGVGYANAANQGFDLVETEFALTVNPDAVVSPDAVAGLLAAADRNPRAAIICPQSINPDGTVELTHDVALFERQHIPPPYHKRHADARPEGELCADFVSGAVNLIRIDAVRALDGYDDNIFLYFEDDDFCLRLRAAGYPLILAPQVRIMHINAGSVRPSLHYSWEKFWNYGWARLYIERKHRGTKATAHLAARHTLLFLFKALGYTLLLKSDRALRDWARFCGTVAYLLGVRAVKPDWRESNDHARQD